MPLPLSPFESLPNELLDEIISLLSTCPPSLTKLRQPPSLQITRSETRDLKNLSRTCCRFLDLVRPWLFSHSNLNLKDVDEFLSLISRLNLSHYVTSIVVKWSATSGSQDDIWWWRRVLREINPLHITIVAPPSFIGSMLDTQIMDGHSWAFEIPLQVLRLECNRLACRGAVTSTLDELSSILAARPWTSLQFHESSSLKAYNHYEYFLFQVPSLFNRWGSLASSKLQSERAQLSLTLKNLTSFGYTAVFPFYNHVKLVLDTVELMTNLQSLSIQLGPCKNDRITEIEQRGSMDPSDPWMELATGYSLIAHTVRDLGIKGRLVKFTTYDYACDALRAELSSIIGDILENEWTHAGQGTWVRKTS